MKVTAPYISFSCPEGANVTLKCSFHGHWADIHDKMGRNWLFSAGRNPQCKERVHPRHVKDNGTHPGLFLSSNHKDTFWIILVNLTVADQGGYCCYVYDIKTEHNKPHLLGSEHGYIELNVTKSSTALGLATAGSILGVLSLPVILLLVYKQRQSIVSNRREPWVTRTRFDEAAPQCEDHGVTQIMMRQSSETGRHLLSEPGTPLSPPALGDCFFPSQGNPAAHTGPTPRGGEPAEFMWNNREIAATILKRNQKVYWYYKDDLGGVEF
ncbi:V-type immunoglobulin domain-containing suppressor of T-cell activation-like isoform X1 [Acipenser oxyrinchus oxyrinchus]|nr:V-type immunoglobulin domain-containing suppressor of T-cell activation-like isoform X1 [Acipenser oxyrinchus oxyrinchus]